MFSVLWTKIKCTLKTEKLCKTSEHNKMTFSQMLVHLCVCSSVSLLLVAFWSLDKFSS